MTTNTNDVARGYARARIDLGCRYTVGFYDRYPKEDQPRQVRVSVVRPGLRVMHPSSYSFPSDRARRENELHAAFLAPGAFGGGEVRAHLFPLHPDRSRDWLALMTVEFRVPIGGDAVPTVREFGGVLRAGPRVVQRFARKLVLTPERRGLGKSLRSASFVEPVVVRPGDHELVVVVSDPAGGQPESVRVAMTVPDVPAKGSFLVEPILGKRAEDDVVIYGSGEAGGRDEIARGDRIAPAAGFRPLLVRSVPSGDAVAVLTHACVGRKRSSNGPERVVRGLRAATGAVVGTLPDLSLARSVESTEPCASMLDVFPVSSLSLGSYVFRAFLDPLPLRDATEVSMRFEVTASKAPTERTGSVSGSD